MKVAIVLNTSWNIYNFRMGLIKALREDGHEIHTVAPVDDYTAFLVEAGCIHHSLTMDSRGVNPIKDLALTFELFGIYRKFRPDVILHFTIKPNVYGTLAASVLQIPTINNVCGLGTIFLKKGVTSRVAKWLYRASFRFATRVFFQNSDDRAIFLEEKLIAPGIADLVPGSGIDLSRFQPVEFKRNKTFTFLLVSRLITDKGILEFVEAIQQLRAEGMDARFQVLGAKDPSDTRGISASIIDSWIATNTIEYLGTTQDVRPFMEQADCIVLPSYREGAPRTLLEAASLGKPIVTTDVPGCHHVVEHEFNGLLCEVKSGKDLAAKMKQMASCSDETLLAFGRNGRKKMEAEFDEVHVIRKYRQGLRALA
ncbi:MAG TPA: glycosyltransferase family 1 protein [Cytophagales bacterium]|nr:glycosyltransferase family 1 protein [Cytophagales bacterium]